MSRCESSFGADRWTRRRKNPVAKGTTLVLSLIRQSRVSRRVVSIDQQRRQISIQRSETGSSQRASNSADEKHDFFFDSVYDWK